MGVVPSHRDPDWSEQCTRTVAAHLISTRSVYGDSGGDGDKEGRRYYILIKNHLKLT